MMDTISVPGYAITLLLIMHAPITSLLTLYLYTPYRKVKENGLPHETFTSGRTQLVVRPDTLSPYDPFKQLLFIKRQCSDSVHKKKDVIL